MSKYVLSFLALCMLASCSTDQGTEVGTQDNTDPKPVENTQPEINEEDISDAAMSFFVTSINPGNGADFGGVEGADQYCQTLAESADSPDATWRAYLSVASTDTQEAVNAKDRIGTGPWYNALGVLVAKDVEELHSESTLLNKTTALDENGNTVMGRGDETNNHDILTGSTTEGMVAGGLDTTCDNWTSSAQGSAIVGHHDRMGLDESEPAKSWNSSHPSRGCSIDDLRGTGGAGLIYCFAE